MYNARVVEKYLQGYRLDELSEEQLEMVGMVYEELKEVADSRPLNSVTDLYAFYLAVRTGEGTEEYPAKVYFSAVDVIKHELPDDESILSLATLILIDDIKRYQIELYVNQIKRLEPCHERR